MTIKYYEFIGKFCVKTNSKILKYYVFIIATLTLSMLITACGGGFSNERNHTWQKKYDFTTKRNPIFNMFVASGGMKKKKTTLTPDEIKMQSEINGINMKSFNNTFTKHINTETGDQKSKNSKSCKKNETVKINLNAKPPGNNAPSMSISNSNNSNNPVNIDTDISANNNNPANANTTVNLQAYVDTNQVPELKE